MNQCLQGSELELASIIRVQAAARRWIARRHYLLVRKLIIKVQAIVRAWLVSKRLLESVRLHARRTRVFFEIIVIEKAYTQDLACIVNDFKYPLLNKHIIEPQEAVKIFGNIETIFDIHDSLLDSLKSIRRSWELKSGIGVCFMNEVHKFEEYQNYIMGFDEASELLRSRLKNGNPNLSKFLKTAERSPKMRNLELSDFLIQPVQRIPRYIMLLKEYMKFTPQNHMDFEIIPKIIQNFNKILLAINSLKRRTMNESKSRFLVQEVSGAHLTGLTEYAMEGELQRTHVHFPKKVYVFLFDEMFVMAKHSTPEKSDDVITGLTSRIAKIVHAKTYRFKLRKAIKIRSLSLIVPDESDAESKTFIMKVALHSHPEKNNDETKSEEQQKTLNDKVYYFKASSEKARMNWVASVDKLMRKYKQ